MATINQYIISFMIQADSLAVFGKCQFTIATLFYNGRMKSCNQKEYVFILTKFSWLT